MIIRERRLEVLLRESSRPLRWNIETVFLPINVLVLKFSILTCNIHSLAILLMFEDLLWSVQRHTAPRNVIEVSIGFHSNFKILF